MRKTISIVIILAGLSGVGCSGGKKLVSTKKDPSCLTSVEGSFQSKVAWTKEAPALVLKDGGQFTVIYGDLMEIKNDGVVFDPRREGLYNAPAKLYPSQDIICAVNKNREVVYGKIPKDYSTGFWNLDIYFVSANQTEMKPFRLSMKTNERFSYCLDPGKYVIKKIIFATSKQYVDETANIPLITFEVAKGHANYLGDLYLDFEMPGKPNVCALPFKAKDRPGAHSAAMFGLVGALLYAASNDNKEGIHTLMIMLNDKFVSVTKSPVKISPLQFSN